MGEIMLLEKIQWKIKNFYYAPNEMHDTNSIFILNKYFPLRADY